VTNAVTHKGIERLLNKRAESPYIYTDYRITSVLAVTYFGELADFGFINQTAHEALARNFFNYPIGGCPYDNTTGVYNCTYDNMIVWLSDLQAWIDAAAVDNTHDQPLIRINLKVLTGVLSDEIGVLPDEISNRRGYMKYMSSIGEIIFNPNNLINPINPSTGWRTGQGPDVASRWGNKVIATSDTIYSLGDEDKAAIVIHLYTYSSITLQTYGSDVIYGDEPENGETRSGGTQLSPPYCTYVALIVTSQGGFGVGTC
jgi:hypothetical protein